MQKGKSHRSLQNLIDRAARSEKLRKLDLKPFIQGSFFEDLLKKYPAPASIATPVSQLCTAKQLEQPEYVEIWDMLGYNRPVKWHRKQWELIFITSVLLHNEFIGFGNGLRGLGFGVGTERLTSLFASRGSRITATDLKADDPAAVAWTKTRQHCASIEKLFYPKLLDRQIFDQSVTFREVDMNLIPDDLVDFDFCWSACALEHLGSLDKGLDFIRNSLACLRPGGIAVHTTEFNLGSNEKTIKNGPAVVYREKDILAFQEELRSQGHQMEVNLNPGNHPLDRFVDAYRTGDIHLRLYIENQIQATSLGLFIRKAS